MDLLFKKKRKNSDVNKQTHPVFKNDFDFIKSSNKPSFKGLTELTAKGIGKILNNTKVQGAIKKGALHSEDVAKNMTIATDLLLSASFAHRTNKSNKIDKNRKKPLIYNNLISTGISITAGSAIDNFVKKNTDTFIKKFTEANKNDPKLAKYITGINVIRPTLIFAGIYYGILPMISTFFAEKLDKGRNN